MVKRKTQLDTFQLVSEDRVISPILTTTRKYGDWFEGTFDEYTSQMELYMKSKKKSGESLLERHPGTRIGHWFDSSNINSDEYKSWYIMQDCPMFDRLVKLQLAQQQDAVPISVNDKEHRNMIRVYTVKQLELYIRTVIDKNFDIEQYVGIPKQIKVRNVDLSKLIIPKVEHKQRRLF